MPNFDILRIKRSLSLGTTSTPDQTELTFTLLETLPAPDAESALKAAYVKFPTFRFHLCAADAGRVFPGLDPSRADHQSANSSRGKHPSGRTDRVYPARRN